MEEVYYSEKIQCDEYTDFRVKFSKEGVAVEVEVNFEYADDFHIWLGMDKMDLFMKKMYGLDGFMGNEKVFQVYLKNRLKKYQFEEDLAYYELEYQAVHY